MSKIYPYRLAEFLHERVGDDLRRVIYYDKDSYEVVFAREDVGTASQQEIEDVVNDLRADSYEQSIREELHGHGPVRSTVWVFEEAVEMHFVADERRGLAVALDSETFLAQNTFVGRCLEIAGLE